MFKTKVIIKIILILLLISYFVDFTAPYYEIKRIATCALFIFLLITSVRQDSFGGIAVSTIGVLIFNPLFFRLDSIVKWDIQLTIYGWMIVLMAAWLINDLVTFINEKRKGFGDFKSMKLNSKTGMYEVIDSGHRYQMDATLYNNLMSYSRQNQIGLVSHWYNQLSEEDKEKINILSEFEGL